MPAQMKTPDHAVYPTNASTLLILELLRKDLLPNFHPLLLLRRKRLPRVLKRFRQDVSQPSTQCLDDEHSLPIRDCKSSSIPIKYENAGKHLKQC
jgi:hypothetical protein